MPHKTYLNWSSGKDAALALHLLNLSSEYEVGTLLTTVNAALRRVSMHGLRLEILELQAQAIGLPLHTIALPGSPTMTEYDSLMGAAVKEMRQQGFTHSAFGDIFLEDLRQYREEQLAKLGIQAVFPLWKRNTVELLGEFIELGFKAVVVCANAQLLGKEAVGRRIDHSFLEDLPPGVDPCGENGEFHTFCYDGPIFNAPVEFETGEKVYREYPAPQQEQGEVTGFWFCELEY